MTETTMNMIKALEFATGLKARRHDKYDNQFYFVVNGTKLWVGVYAEYEITADHVGRSGTRVPVSLVEAAAYVKSAGKVFPDGRGTVSTSLYKKSAAQRELHRSVDLFAQIDAMTEAKPVEATTGALVNPVLVHALIMSEDEEIADLLAKIEAVKARKASKAAQIQALKDQLAALEAEE